MSLEKNVDIIKASPIESSSEHVRVSELGEVYEKQSVGYSQYREAINIDISPEEARKVRWKIDLIVLPIFLVTQALQYMDRTALNYANLFGYQKALGLKGQEFNYLSAMVYAGHFFAQYPYNWLIGRYDAQKVLAIAILLWGIMVLLMTQCYTYSSALAVRFLMGLFEAAVTPGLTLMTGFWWTRREIPLRQCIWWSSLGWGGITASYISMGISTMSDSTRPQKWQLVFYILGGVTVVWSFIVYAFLPDTPSNARFLNHRERLVAVTRVAGNETGIKNRAFNRSQVSVAFYDPKTIILFISIFGAAIPNGVLSAFSTIVIRDLGFSTTTTTQLKSVGDAVLIVTLFIGGIVTLNVPNSRLLTSTVANLLCTVAAACMAYLPRSNVWGRLVSFWLVNAQSVGFTVSLTTISSNMAGYTHRSIASGIIFTAHCWGNFAGPFVVKESEAPEYKGATIGLLIGYCIKLGCHLALLIYMFLENRRRDRVYGPADKTKSDEAGMQDKTEFENKHFRYVL